MIIDILYIYLKLDEKLEKKWQKTGKSDRFC